MLESQWAYLTAPSSSSSGSSTGVPFMPAFEEILSMPAPKKKRRLISKLALPCDDGCLFSVYLLYDCAIEVSEGLAYSIGDQYLNVMIVGDTCGCLRPPAALLINGKEPPVYVSDGDLINVWIFNAPVEYTQEGPICEDLEEFRALLKKTILRRLKKIE